MSKFTQGEWYLNETEDYRGYICSVAPIQHRPIAYIEGLWNEGYNPTAEANARLIVAAPKMYERLKLVARLLSRQAQGQFNDNFDPAIADSIYELLAEIDDEPVETMKYSSSFFQNRNCEYFPCHEVEDADCFSCLFCFCPLYHMEKCGGKYQMLSNGVKDCSECSMPHLHYDWVINMLKEAERAEKQS